MFSVKLDVVHGVLELHLGGSYTEQQLSDLAQELKSVFEEQPEPPFGVLLERKTARPANQHVLQLLGKLWELIHNAGVIRFADVGSADVPAFNYNELTRRFESEDEARRWLLQPMPAAPKP